MTRPIPPARLMLLVAFACALAACDQGKAPGTSTTPITGSGPAAGAPSGTATVDAAMAGLAESEPPLPELGDFRIVSVLMGNAVDAENVVLADSRAFAAADAIHASVLSIGAHQGLKLSADWLAPDGSSFARSEQAIVPASDLATTFKVHHPAGWPTGDYQLRIAINGHTVRIEKFSVL